MQSEMGTKASVGLILFLAMIGLSRSSDAYVFVVGDKDGWVPHPTEGYNHWAGRHRFQINDSLLFKYKQGNDSVLVVTKIGYALCNTSSPIASLIDGDSLFTFDRSGPFFFISGNPDNCKNGQRLVAVVLSPREKVSPPPPTPTMPASPSPDSPPMSPPVNIPPPVPAVPSPISSPEAAPIPAQSFSPKGCSSSGAVVLGFIGLVSYLVLPKA